MVTLTQEATDKLRSLIAEEADPDAGLRVQVVPGGCSGFEYDLSLAAPAEDFKALTDEYWAFVLRENPVLASTLGHRQYDAHPAGRQ